MTRDVGVNDSLELLCGRTYELCKYMHCTRGRTERMLKAQGLMERSDEFVTAVAIVRHMQQSAYQTPCLGVGCRDLELDLPTTLLSLSSCVSQ